MHQNGAGLEEAWKARSDAGDTVGTLKNARCGYAKWTAAQSVTPRVQLYLRRQSPWARRSQR